MCNHDLSLDCWRGFAAFNVNDDAFHVHTKMKDNKASQVRRLFATNLEGSCRGSGTNGLEGYFRPKNGDL